MDTGSPHLLGTYTTYMDDMGYIDTEFWKQDNLIFTVGWCIAPMTLFTVFFSFSLIGREKTIYFF